MDKPSANPTPKAKFQEIKGAIDAHHTLIETESFKRACDAALLEYQRKLAVELANEPVPTQQVRAMGHGWKLNGVSEFLSELRNLAEKPADPPKGPGLARVLDHQN
jgi:hypothetical protein